MMTARPNVVDSTRALTLPHFRTHASRSALTVEHMIAEGDWVAARWRMEGTHRPTETRIANYTGRNMWQVKGGKLVEIRNNRDDLLVFHQLGLIPSRAELWQQAGMKPSPYLRDGVSRVGEADG